jgi:hypothetical protein
MLKHDIVSDIHPALQAYITIPFDDEDQPLISLTGREMAFSMWMEVNPELTTVFIQ